MRIRINGFTLVELLVVILILGILMSVLLPRIFATRVSAEESRCRGIIGQLAVVAKTYDTDTGDYPPDDLASFPGRLRLTLNRENDGIEAFVVALATSGSSSCMRLLDDMDSQGLLGNTDNDRAGGVIGALQRREQMEILDPWDNPFAYFHHRNYRKPQTVHMSDGTLQLVRPVENPSTGGFLEPRRFQILSAGPDGKFGTGDDIGNFQMPEEE